MPPRTRREKLHHNQIAITIHDESADAITFRVNDTPCIRDLIEIQDFAAEGNGGGDFGTEPMLVDRNVLVRFENADRDARVTVIKPATNPITIHANDVHDGAGLRALLWLLHEALKNPRMRGLPRVLQANSWDGVIHAVILTPCPERHVTPYP